MNEYFLKDVCILNAYKQVPASLIDELSCESKDIALLPSSKDYGLFTSKDLGNEYVCEGEVITIGRARYANIKYWKGSFISSNNIIIQSKDEKLVLTKYLYYYFLCNNKKVYIEKTTYPVFDKDHFNKLTIMIPPLQEQAAIVEKLDLISEAIECEEERIHLYDELVKSKFLELFGNPLTPQEFNYLEEIALLERGKFSPRPRNDPKYFNGEYPYIQTGDISSSEHRLRNHTQTLNELGIKVSKKFNIGTIVIAIVGATVGATAILEKEVYAPDSVIGITPYEYNNIFLETLLQFWRKELLAIAPDCARANINLEILGKVPILKVDIDKQNDFAKLVQILDNEKQNVKNIKRYFEELQVNEMHKYFE